MSSDNHETPTPGSVTRLLDGMRSGNAEAQCQLLERYRDQVVSYACYRLKQHGVRSKDADDIAQEVFMGLFRRAQKGQFTTINNRNELWAKLCSIARDRVIDARRKKLPFTESAVSIRDNSSVAPGQLRIADQKDLDVCFLLVEQDLVWRKMAESKVALLPDVADMKMQGYTVQEIADSLELSKRTVERYLKWIDEICEKYARQ